MLSVVAPKNDSPDKPAMNLHTRPAYPSALEAWWLAAAREKLNTANNHNALRTLEPEVAKLSDGFTTERAAGFDAYAQNENALLAYGLFYFPQTFARSLFQFDEIANRGGWKPSGKTVRIADLGAGSGAAGLALASRLCSDNAVELIAYEKSSASLDLAGNIARDNPVLWPKLKFAPRCAGLETFATETGDAFDIIIASFSLNEAFHGKDDATFEAWCDSALGRLAPGGLLLISEPAMKLTSTRLGKLRDRVAAAGKMSILAPCLHAQPCPMVAAAGSTDFCHEVRWWLPPPSLQSLNSKLFRTIQFLKFSFVAIANNAPAPQLADAGRARLVSPMMDLKGKMQCDGCAADGALRRYEILARKFAGGEKASFLKTERGDVVRWETLSLLGDGKTNRAESVVRESGFD